MCRNLKVFLFRFLFQIFFCAFVKIKTFSKTQAVFYSWRFFFFFFYSQSVEAAKFTLKYMPGACFPTEVKLNNFANST